MSGFGDDISFDIGFQADEGSIRDATDRASAAIRRQFERAFRNFPNAVDRLVNPQEARRLADAVGDIGNASVRTESRIEALQADMEALRRRAEATRETLARVGADPQLFAIIDRELNRVLSTARAFNEDIERIAADPNLLRGYEVSFEDANRRIFREVAGLQSILKNLGDVQRVEGNRLNSVADRQAQERIATAQQLNSRLIVEQQQAGAQTLATQRVEGQRLIQRERQRSRTRIEILRFTLRQIQFIERQIAAAFRAGARLAVGALERIEAGTRRLGQVFRRSNRDLNDGLRGALLRRETSIDRSFDRQTREIRSSLTQQERIIQRFQARASTGVAGIATGRSGFGALLGGGLAFGGGFLLIDKLKEGFDESVNLNESLNKTRAIFGDAADEVVRFAQNSTEALFVTRSAALEAASNFGIFGKAAGLTGPALSDFSKDLVSLATDLASFNNTTIDDATTAISAALRGESEPIRRYGVLLNEATLQQRALELGIIDTTRKLQPFERVLAANAEIFAQTADQQGDAARTADDFANSSRRAGAAATETFAAIAGNLVPIATLITNRAFPALNFLTRFIRNEVGPGLRVLRDGLIGAGAALGALLVARVAGEAIQFLGLALRGLLTPLGLFVAAVAGLGAAINILSSRSPAVRAAIQTISEAVRQGLGLAIELVSRAVAALGDLLAETVLPLLVTFAQFVARNLNTAIRAAFDYLIGTAIPAIVDFGRVVADRVVPPVQALAEFLGGVLLDALRAARDLAVAFFDAVVPLVGPAIDGFRQLGEAIAAAFTDGDFGGLLDALGAVAVGIGRSFANVGRAIIDVVRPQIQRALAFIRDLFSIDNLRPIAFGFLEVVETIGRILGSIVSDRRFILAVEGLIAAAAIIGFRFVKGFVEGITSNLGELTSLFGNQLLIALREGLRFAFDNPSTIAAVILAGFGARTILNAFRSVGERGATSTVAGFGRGVVNAARSNRAYLLGFFGGRDALSTLAAEEGRRSARSFQRQFERAQRDLRRLGVTPETSLISGATATDVERLNRQLEETKARMNDVAVEAGLTGRRARQVFDGMIGVARGFARIGLGDVRAGFQQMRDSVRLAGRAITDQFAAWRAQGVALGQRLGQGVLFGLGAVLAGQQLGQGSTLFGLTGLLASSLAAFAVGGPLIGSAVLGVGLLTAAFTDNDEAAQRAAASVDRYRSAVQDAGSRAEIIAGFGQQVADDLLALDATAQRVLSVAGFDVARFVEAAFTATDAASAIEAGFSGVAGGFQSVFGELEEGRRITEALTNAYDSIRGGTRELALESQIMTGVQRGLNEKAQESVVSFSNATGAYRDFQRALTAAPIGPALDLSVPARRARDQIRDISVAVEQLNQVRTNEINERINDISTRLGLARDAAQQARDGLVQFLTGDYENTFQQGLDQVVSQIPSIGQQIEEAFNLGAATGSVRGGAALRQATEGLDAQIAATLARGLEDGSIIDNATAAAALEPIRRAAQEAFNQIVDPESGQTLISRRALDEINRQIDEAVNSADFELGLLVVNDAEAEVARLQAAYDRLELDLTANVEFDPEQIAEAFEAAFGASLNPDALASSQRAAFERATATAPATDQIPVRSGSRPETVVIEQLTINETGSARATGNEVIRSLAARAAGLQ